MKITLAQAMGTCFGVQDAIDLALDPQFRDRLTVVGQLVDTTVFLTLAFGATLGFNSLLELIVTSYSFKVIYEVLATPLTYWVVNTLKRIEGIDACDFNTDFNPFHKALGP